MKFKIRVDKLNDISKLLYKGRNALDIPEGTVVLVVKGTEYDQNSIIVRTNDYEKPFRTIYNPADQKLTFGLWGLGLDDYEFKVISNNLQHYLNCHVDDKSKHEGFSNIHYV